jgi:hypothetical protein
MTGELVPFDPLGWRQRVEDDLEDLAAHASEVLDAPRYPMPDDSPPRGVWLRLIHLDDDARGVPQGLWHYGLGWDEVTGNYPVRCRKRRTRVDDWLYWRHDGRRHSQRRAQIQRLFMSESRPDDGACQQCSAYLERDAKLADTNGMGWKLVFYLVGHLQPVAEA